MPSKDSSDLVWHYTNAEGLEGILQQGRVELKASSVSCMNDTTEVIFGRSSLKGAALAVMERGDGAARSAARRVLDVFEQAGGVRKGPWLDAFVVSFSKKGDQLSEWEVYAGRAGYAIGFELEAVKRFVEERGGPLLIMWGFWR